MFCIHAVIHGLLVEGHNDISNKFKVQQLEARLVNTSFQEEHCGTTSHHTLEIKVTNQALPYGFVSVGTVAGLSFLLLSLYNSYSLILARFQV